MFADLHVHTSFSDGTCSPEELVRAAKKSGLDCVAVVDHDTVCGLAPGMEAGSARALEVLAGLELTAQYENQEIHILGYLIDPENKALLKKLELLKNNRTERVYKILEKLKTMGVELSAEAVFNIAGNATPGRLHIARAMVKEGLAGSISHAFQKYIGDRCPAYALGFQISPPEAVELIKGAGGIPVLAHPYMIKDDEALLRIIGSGVMGLEVYYPEHSQSMVNFYLDLAKKYGLLITGGSDFHGEGKPDVKLGSLKVPYELVERLKEAKRKMCV